MKPRFEFRIHSIKHCGNKVLLCLRGREAANVSIAASSVLIPLITVQNETKPNPHSPAIDMKQSLSSFLFLPIHGYFVLQNIHHANEVEKQKACY